MNKLIEFLSYARKFFVFTMAFHYFMAHIDPNSQPLLLIVITVCSFMVLITQGYNDGKDDQTE